MYRDRVRAALHSSERKLFAKLNTPGKIQDYLDTIRNDSGDTYLSPRSLIRDRHAHCFEGAVFAAAVLAFHGKKPLLMDLKSQHPDIDHVVALYKVNGLWGAISKTNHAVLRYRDPIYPDPKTLALTYFHEYFLDTGKKTLRSYAGPFDLSVYPPEKWITAGEQLDWLVEKLDFSRHFPLVPKKNVRHLRKASCLEIDAYAPTEWPEKKSKKR